MSAPEMDIDWMREQAELLIEAAVDDDNSVRQLEVWKAVDDQYGTRGIYCMCCALAETVAILAGCTRESGKEWAFSVFDTKTGRSVTPESVSAEDDAGAAIVAATRFVIAVLNRDGDQSLALFDAPQSDESAVAIPVGLVALVRLHGRHKIEELRRG